MGIHCLFQVPTLETPDGAIFESNAIARYGKFIYLKYLYLFCSFKWACFKCVLLYWFSCSIEG